MTESHVPSWWRRPAGAILLAALALGTMLRFIRLGSRELTIDESLSWAESSGRTVTDVLHLQHWLDSGKFPIYELTQHVWIRAFGDSEAALRALSALIGLLSIVLVYIVALEAMRTLKASATEQAEGEERIHFVAALAALLFAIGLPSVEIARQARMYSMLQGWILVQMIFLLRARRLGGWTNYAALTAATAVAVATNFTAVLVMAAEALWVAYLYFADGARGERERRMAPLLIGLAYLAAVAILLPFFGGLRYGVEGVKRGDYNWIKPPGHWEPLATLESGLGTWAFPLFVLFGVIGAVALWRRNRDEAVLMLLWLWLPPIALFIGSYVFLPMLVTRYLISSFVPVFILSAIGLDSIPTRNYRAIAIAGLTILCVLRASADLRPGDTKWRDACEVALTKAGSDKRIGAGSERYIVKYYIPPTERGFVKVMHVPVKGTQNKAPDIVIMSPTMLPDQVAQIRREYPVVVAKFKNVTVVSRPEASPAAGPPS